MGEEDFREWYFGETEAQAKAAIKAIQDAELDRAMSLQALLPQVE